MKLFARLLALLAVWATLGQPLEAQTLQQRLGADRARSVAITLTQLNKPNAGLATAPFNTFRRSDGAFVTDFNYAATLPPSCSVTYYVKPAASGGSGGNTGLSYAQAFRSMRGAQLAANAYKTANPGATVGCVQVDAATYRATNTASSAFGTIGDAFQTGNGAQAATMDMVWSVNPATPGQVVSILDAPLPAWTVFSGAIYRSSVAYTGTIGAVLVDTSKLDSTGQPVRTDRVLSVANTADPSAEINAAWAAGRGAMWQDATNKYFYVRLSDNRAPDASVFATSTAVAVNITSTAARKLWMKGFSLYGGGTFTATGATGIGHTIYIEDGVFNYTTGSDAVQLISGPTVFVCNRCIASYSDRDGFNAHGPVAGPATDSPSLFTINSKGLYNGTDGAGTNNWWTLHEYTRGQDVNGYTWGAADRPIANVGNSLAWMLGTYSGGSRGAGEASANFNANQLANTGTTKLWLDSPVSGGSPSTYDFVAENTSGTIGQLYFFNPKYERGAPNNIARGLIATYAP